MDAIEKLMVLADSYGRACRRDGAPARESDEGKALEAALQKWKREPAMGVRCSVCQEWQQWTPSGMVRKNGHGGADGINQPPQGHD